MMYLTLSNFRVRACLFIWLVLTILVMVETPAVSTAQQPKVEVRQVTITSQALAGNLFGDPTERTVYVLLPPGYATSDHRYPVVYVMPWGDGEPTDNASSFAWAMESLLGRGVIKEMIVVVPDGSSKLKGGLFLSSSTLGDYETYVTQEVVDYVETHYRTLPTRDSRGLAGCSNGGTTSMRLGFKYPTVFSVVAATDGEWDYSSPEVWPSNKEEMRRSLVMLKELPRDVSDLDIAGAIGWFVLMAAATVPDPDNPPFYCDMPFRIVDGQAEVVPEILTKMVEIDTAHEARRYVQQPVRLRGILLRRGVYDPKIPMSSVHSFVQVLTDLGIEHEYVEEESDHCGYGWEAASLKYMSDKLVFEEK
jgi:poly(3-hydroxybutyrate) depolymerase